MRAMQKQIYVDRSKLTKAVADEISKAYPQMQNQIQEDVAKQVVAMVLKTLDEFYGWKKKRLSNFVDNLNIVCEEMEGTGFAKSYDADDLKVSMKKLYGIDLDEKIKTEPCVVKEEKNDS